MYALKKKKNQVLKQEQDQEDPSTKNKHEVMLPFPGNLTVLPGEGPPGAQGQPVWAAAWSHLPAVGGNPGAERH